MSTPTSEMAAARGDTTGIRPARIKAMLPWATQLQNLGPQRTQSYTEEALWHLHCEPLCPLWLRLLCPETTRALRFVSTRLQSLIRRALPARLATAEVRLDGVSQTQDR